MIKNFYKKIIVVVLCMTTASLYSYNESEYLKVAEVLGFNNQAFQIIQELVTNSNFKDSSQEEQQEAFRTVVTKLLIDSIVSVVENMPNMPVENISETSSVVENTDNGSDVQPQENFQLEGLPYKDDFVSPYDHNEVNASWTDNVKNQSKKIASNASNMASGAADKAKKSMKKVGKSIKKVFNFN